MSLKWITLFSYDSDFRVFKFGVENHRAKCSFPQHHIKGPDYQHGITVDVRLRHLVRVLCFSTVKEATLLPLLVQYVLPSPTLRSAELCSTSLRKEYLHKLSGILLHEICLSNH